MWYLSNSQDVVSNSHVCSGAYCGFQHSPSVTEILLHFPVEPWELECCSFLDSNYSSCTIGLGCDWTGKHQARHWQKLFTVSPEYLSFLPVFLWLPNSAFFCRMHGCAFFTVEHLWEGFEVLQRSHHPEQRERTYLCGCTAWRPLLWKTESYVHEVIYSQITQFQSQSTRRQLCKNTAHAAN